jgi:hypothetical protein
LDGFLLGLVGLIQRCWPLFGKFGGKVIMTGDIEV